MASRVVPHELTGSDQVIIDTQVVGPQGPGTTLLYGWSIRETAGLAAEVRIRQGTDATGSILAAISFIADSSNSEWYGPQGVRAGGGVFVEVVSGTVEGAVYAG